jgi:signal transduction histidine kinase
LTVLSRIDAVMMILRTLCDITDLRYSVVARLTEESWTACAIYDNMNFGLSPGDGLELRTTYCNTIREQSAPLLVRHASREPEFQNHPALKHYAVESYIGVPLYRENGEYFGVLCALDTEPKSISEKNIGIFTLMAKLIAHELEADEQRRELDEALKLANRTNEARARFLSILGHDLRSPLNTIISAATMQQSVTLDATQARRLAKNILRTSRRMQFLIEDLLDVAQTAQGNQILIQKKQGDLRDVFQPIVEEFRLAQPDRVIEFFAPDACHGEWDEGRLGQVLSNLISNALSYGGADFPIVVELADDSERVRLRVTNWGETMSEEVRKNLFNPFWRGAKRVSANANSSGLGLGLFIVKQIVEAHGASIEVESTDDTGTTFTVTFPRPPSA